MRQAHIGRRRRSELPAAGAAAAVNNRWLARASAALRAEHAWRYDHPGEAIDAAAAEAAFRPQAGGQRGDHRRWPAPDVVGSAYDLYPPGKLYHLRGLGTMGFGLPAAVGAQVARPNDTVICISVTAPS